MEVTCWTHLLLEVQLHMIVDFVTHLLLEIQLHMIVDFVTAISYAPSTELR